MLLKGIASYAKIVGAPVPNYFDNEKLEWSFELANLSDEDVTKLKEAGCSGSIKNKKDDRENFVQLKRNSVKADGTPAKPIEVVDCHGQPWGSDKIGNGSTLHVIASVRESEYKGKKRNVLSPIKVLVWDHVPYAGRDEFTYKPVEVATEGTPVESAQAKSAW